MHVNIKVPLCGGRLDFGKRGPILAAKIGPPKPVLATKVAGGQVFSCQNRSGQTNFTGTDFGVTV